MKRVMVTATFKKDAPNADTIGHYDAGRPPVTVTVLADSSARVIGEDISCYIENFDRLLIGVVEG